MKVKIFFDYLGFNIQIEEDIEDQNVFNFINKTLESLETNKSLISKLKGESILVNNSFKEKKEKISEKRESNKKINELIQNNNKSEKLDSSLLIDKDKIIKKLKQYASQIMGFTIDGEIIYKGIEKGELSNIDQIYLTMIEKKLLFEENIIDEEDVSSENISHELNISQQQIGARLSDLIGDNKIKRISRGKYKISTYSALTFLESLLNKRKIK